MFLCKLQTIVTVLYSLLHAGHSQYICNLTQSLVLYDTSWKRTFVANIFFCTLYYVPLVSPFLPGHLEKNIYSFPSNVGKRHTKQKNKAKFDGSKQNWNKAKSGDAEKCKKRVSIETATQSCSLVSPEKLNMYWMNVAHAKHTTQHTIPFSKIIIQLFWFHCSFARAGPNWIGTSV